MELIKLSKEEINSYASDFWHRTEWTDYCVNSSKVKGADETITFADKGKIITIVPLIREGEEYTFQGSFGPCILLEDITYKQKVIDELKSYVKKQGIKRIAIEGYMPGFINHTKQICVSDLSKQQVRKSYKSLMKNKELWCGYIGSTTIDIDTQVDLIKTLYYSVAKKSNRPECIFKKFSHWIKKGYASIVTANVGNEAVGFALVTHYNQEAYYFMSATKEDYKNLNVSHFLQGEIFSLLKEKWVTDYILGDIENNSLLSCPNKKEKDISFFKSGFGNAFMYKVVSEYFTDAEYFKKVYSQRLENYLGAELNEDSNVLSQTRTT